VTDLELIAATLAEIDRVRALPVEYGPESSITRAHRSGVMHRAGLAIGGGKQVVGDRALAQQCLADLRAIA
jgi:hypothetical protein